MQNRGGEKPLEDVYYETERDANIYDQGLWIHS